MTAQSATKGCAATTLVSEPGVLPCFDPINPVASPLARRRRARCKSAYDRTLNSDSHCHRQFNDSWGLGGSQARDKEPLCQRPTRMRRKSTGLYSCQCPHWTRPFSCVETQIADSMCNRSHHDPPSVPV